VARLPPGVDIDIDPRVWPWWRPIRKSDISTTAGGALTTSQQIAPTGVCKQLIGWAVAETTNAAGASFRLWDGVNVQGSVLARVNLATNESNRERAGPPGIHVVSGGIYLQMLSGSIEGVIYWI
jgi:hypothetical protein